MYDLIPFDIFSFLSLLIKDFGPCLFLCEADRPAALCHSAVGGAQERRMHVLAWQSPASVSDWLRADRSRASRL